MIANARAKIDFLFIWLSNCCSHTLANLTATPLRIEHFSVFRVSAQSQRIHSAFAVHSQWISAHSHWSRQRAKFFQPVQKFFNSKCSLRGVVLQSPWVRSAFAIKLTETALRLRCAPTETAVRLWRMHGDCAANHIRYNRNDVLDCFVINFILRNNAWWKGNGKINDSLNVSY